MARKRAANLLSLRSKLMDQMAWTCSQHAKWGKGYTYDQWRTWLERAVIDRDYMGVATRIWQTDWLQNECRPEALKVAQGNKSKYGRRKYLRSVYKTHVRWHYGNYNLAKAFLKQPDANLSAIVNAWAE